MKKIPPLQLIVFCLALLLSLPAAATKSDVDKEQRWADQVIDGLLDGDEVWLADSGGHEFLGVYTEGDGGGKAVILVHGIGVHPNWPDVIYPLRAGLLEQGTTTLSIQMPILPNEAEESEYAPLFAEVPGRFAAAIGFLRESGYDQITVVSHSLGASMTSYYISRGVDSAITSFVLIGMGAGVAFPQNIESYASSKVPLLDLYGGKDLDSVLTSAAARAAAGSRIGDGKFSQVSVPGANHFFQGHEEALLAQVLAWLEAH